MTITSSSIKCDPVGAIWSSALKLYSDCSLAFYVLKYSNPWVFYSDPDAHSKICTSSNSDSKWRGLEAGTCSKSPGDLDVHRDLEALSAASCLHLVIRCPITALCQPLCSGRDHTSSWQVKGSLSPLCDGNQLVGTWGTGVQCLQVTKLVSNLWLAAIFLPKERYILPYGASLLKTKVINSSGKGL